jgi:hypothetical protein
VDQERNEKMVICLAEIMALDLEIAILIAKPRKNPFRVCAAP